MIMYFPYGILHLFVQYKSVYSPNKSCYEWAIICPKLTPRAINIYCKLLFICGGVIFAIIRKKTLSQIQYFDKLYLIVVYISGLWLYGVHIRKYKISPKYRHRKIVKKAHMNITRLTVPCQSSCLILKHKIMIKLAFILHSLCQKPMTDWSLLRFMSKQWDNSLNNSDQTWCVLYWLLAWWLL